MIAELIGKIPLSASSELRFEISSYKGRPFINIRRYVESDRFTGYTKKGVALNDSNARKILESLQKFNKDFITGENNEICRIPKNETTFVIVYIIPPDDRSNKTLLDVREYVESESYTGWTQKGFRLPLNRVDEVIHLLSQCLIKFDNNIPILPNDTSKTDERRKPCKYSNHNNGKILIKEIINSEIPSFPEGFLQPGDDINLNDGSVLQLPLETVYPGPMRGAKQEIISEAGFEYLAQSQVVAKYICYAHQHGKIKIVIPAKPFITFKIVKRYEVFIRDLKKQLIQLLIRRTKDKNTAKDLAQRYFRDSKLPWLEEEKE